MKDCPHTVHFLFFNIKPIVKFLSCYRQQSYERPLQPSPWCIWKPNVASLEKSCCNLKCITETGTWRVTAALHICCFISLCLPTFLPPLLNVLNLRISLSRAFHAITKNFNAFYLYVLKWSWLIKDEYALKTFYFCAKGSEDTWFQMNIIHLFSLCWVVGNELLGFLNNWKWRKLNKK